jgi:hypothetical protein
VPLQLPKNKRGG